MLPVYQRDDEHHGLAATDWFKGSLQEYIIGEMNAEGRFYHTMEHIYSLCSHFIGDIAPNFLLETDFDEVAEVILPAIAFHDIVYDPTRSDNEELSSAKAFLYLPPNLPIEEIQRCIMATKTHKAQTVTEKIMCDIDMQILSTWWPTYLEYARNIRREYIHVPIDDYVKGRSDFIRKLLHSGSIYHLELTLCSEQGARANLARELANLEERPLDFLLC